MTKLETIKHLLDTYEDCPVILHGEGGICTIRGQYTHRSQVDKSKIKRWYQTNIWLGLVNYKGKATSHVHHWNQTVETNIITWFKI